MGVFWLAARDYFSTQLLQIAVGSNAEELLCRLYEKGEYVLAANDQEERDASGDLEGALPAIRPLRALVLLKVAA